MTSKKNLQSKTLPSLKLNLGSGQSPKEEGWINVDIIKTEHVDVVCDLGKDIFPWKNNSVREVQSSHFLEHLDGRERIHLFNELYRVLTPEIKNSIGEVLCPPGKAQFVVPYYSSMRSIQDPTHCYDGETDILTENGWKNIKNIIVGEVIPTLNLQTLSIENSPCISTLKKQFKGNLLYFKTDSMDLMVTPDHTMVWGSGGKQDPKWNMGPASEFLQLTGHHSRRGISTIPNDNRQLPTYYTIPNVDRKKDKLNHPVVFELEDFMRFMGWYISEGNIDLSSEGRYRIIISQNEQIHPNYYREIRDLIKKMGFNPCCKENKITFSSKELALYLSPLGLSENKYIPQDIKSLPSFALRILLETALRGDGRNSGSTSCCYATVSQQLADDIQEIAIRAGFRSTQSIEKRETYSIKGRTGPARDMYLVSIFDSQYCYYPQPQEIPFNGKVYCLTVEKNHTLLTRRNGRVVWSGNCWPPLCEASFLYFNKQWRETNKLDHYNIEADFNFSYGHAWDIVWGQKNSETRQFANMHYNNVISDLVVNLEVVKEPLIVRS